ncbi:MAG: DUF429 domain-containing protein [Chthonomonas sp.]|nr:DUF429 domain-containing protein [Chthonomonas sp.]
MLVGVDGCKNAWIAISQTVDGGLDSHHVSDLEQFIDDYQPKVVAIDIPIGLVESGARQCDVAARKLLGKRKSSVFPAPILPALAAKDRQTADAITRSVDGKGVPAQAFGIYLKVREVDELLRARPEFQNIIYEVHPELCFNSWNAETPMVHPKKSGSGFMERIALVEATFGPDAFPGIRARYVPSRVADDDILDAFAALWTARRIAAGKALTCPAECEMSPTGLRMAMWY